MPAIVSATDPVSVIATFRTLGAPARLATLVEAESLFNDGTAVVIFLIAVRAVDADGAGVDEHASWVSRTRKRRIGVFVVCASG